MQSWESCLPVLGLLLIRCGAEADEVGSDWRARLVRKERAGAARYTILRHEDTRQEMSATEDGSTQNEFQLHVEHRQEPNATEDGSAQNESLLNMSATVSQEPIIEFTGTTTTTWLSAPLGCPKFTVSEEAGGGFEFVREYILNDTKCCFTKAEYELAHAWTSCDHEVSGWHMEEGGGYAAVNPHSCCMVACPDGQFYNEGRCCLGTKNQPEGCKSLYEANNEASRCNIFGQGVIDYYWAPNCPPPQSSWPGNGPVQNRPLPSRPRL